MLRLKKGMKLGVASSSMQIEGGDIDSNWHEWARKGKIKDGTSPSNANDHWNRYEEDFTIMQEMSITEYRFGIEWTRIEPKEGEFDEAAINHYRGMIISMRNHGIRPLMTLWHFSHPMWFENKGGFLHIENNEYFLRYVKKVLESLGDLVEEYVTINEPNVYAVNSFYFGEWPPSDKNGVKKAIKVMSVLAAAHIDAFKLIKEYNKDYKVGFAHHVRIFRPRRKKDIPFAKFASFIFQDGLSYAFYKGDFRLPFINYKKHEKGIYSDFIGLNYYSHTFVDGKKFDFMDGLPKNDLGWDIVSKDIGTIVDSLYDILPVPIYITENGTCDNEDKFRSRYIYSHLKVLSYSDKPISRFYHWSFSDNFEWAEGETSRFGLVHIDYETQKRTIKKSGYFYKDIISNHGVTKAAFDKYVVPSHYKK